MVSYHYNKGITLIELLVVIVIVGVLAAIAIPSYNSYIVRARRADAKTALEQVRSAQEMWRAEKGHYATDALDGAGTAEAKLHTTMGVPATIINQYYTWSFTTKTATQFTAQATPTGTQVSDGFLTIDETGTKKDSAGIAYPSPYSKWSK